MCLVILRRKLSATLIGLITPFLNNLDKVSKRKANWMGHILRRKCLLQQVIEGKIKKGIEVTARRGRRRRKLLDELN